MIFGSTAIKHYYPEFRKPSDLDVMCRVPYANKNMQFIWADTFEEIITLSKNKTYLDPELILTIKASHANWNQKWEKTMYDILFLKNKGCSINVKLYKKLVKDWRKTLGHESSPLKGKTNDTFFEDAVIRKYIHDDIHKAVAFYSEPLYERIKPDPDKVSCSEKLFNKLSFDDKLKLAQEEIFVTAIERFLIPTDMSKGVAYQKSLKKFITTMSSNWMSLFLIDNYKHLTYNNVKVDYYAKFKENERNCRRRN